MENQPAAITNAFVDTPRLRFHYRSHGRIDGMPLLFLHSSFGSSRWWEPLFDLLPSEFLAVAPDLRGCGQSDKPETGYTIEAQAEDVAAFVDTLGLRDFDVVAHAAGGAIAVEYILGHPDTARSLLLVNSVPVEGVFTPLEAVTLLAQLRTDRALLTQAMELLAPRLAAENPPLFAALVEDAAVMAPAAFTEVAVALGRWNRFADAKALTLPTLLLWGDKDPIVARDAMTRSLIAIPGAANLDILRGVGHSPMLDAPLTLAEHLVAFVTDDFGDFASIRDSAAA
jgi:branched-chain amino acid transport system permease protein